MAVSGAYGTLVVVPNDGTIVTFPSRPPTHMIPVEEHIMGTVVAMMILAFGLLYFAVAAEERRLEALTKAPKR
ncbi:MAG TPA: hypothetical protein VMH85_02365 [Terriglobales bacterium]|nr:hypothetical protein [Terriglobales bacterium]